MTTGEKIKLVRTEKGMTQDELGKLVGVQRAAINKYENGSIVNLKRSTIAKLSNALGVDPLWLMDENEKPAEISGLSEMSDKDLRNLFMQLIAQKDKNYLLMLASEILEIASKK